MAEPLAKHGLEEVRYGPSLAKSRESPNIAAHLPVDPIRDVIDKLVDWWRENCIVLTNDWVISRNVGRKLPTHV
jgi:hypothetical protein